MQACCVMECVLHCADGHSEREVHRREQVRMVPCASPAHVLEIEEASAKGAQAHSEGNTDVASMLFHDNVFCAAQTNFADVSCVDASKADWYPAHHRHLSLRKEEASAKGAQEDNEGNKDTSGFQFKVFSLCYITSFDEVLLLSYFLPSVKQVLTICARNTSDCQVNVFPLCCITSSDKVTLFLLLELCSLAGSVSSATLLILAVCMGA